ncbi:MAG TPA: TraR/DksA C4-type zinc finger protein [Acidimicrobiales bacterium]|nr:TraR/DksA C4-type zinc finger protein [Acidimicrobiales bacterium]
MSNDASTVDYRALLEEERSQLRDKLAELGFGDGGSLSYDANFADSSQVTAERGEAEALALQLRDALAEVEHALNKLADGSYGQCESCGKPIAPARLEAKPAARQCIDCASKR